MLRIDTSDRTTSLPSPPAKGAQDGYFRPKNAGIGQLGTIVPHYWMNFIQESLRQARVDAGVSEPADWLSFDWLTSTINALASAVARLIPVLNKSASYTAVAGDVNRLFVCTSTFTLSLTAAATLGAGWWCHVRNDGVGLITIDPNAAETIDGSATLTVRPGESLTIICDGSNFKTVGRHLSAYRLLTTATISGGSSSVNIDGFFTADYDWYDLVLQDVQHSTTNTSLWLRYNQGGSPVSSANYKYGGGTSTSAGVSGNISGTGAAQIVLTNPQIGNSAGEAHAGTYRLYSPLGTTMQKLIEGHGVTNRSADADMEIVSMSGLYAGNTTALSGVTLLPSSGTFAGGKVFLYGGRNS